MQHTTIDTIREQFPILKRAVYNKQLVYFDNAATTQKPQSVIDEIVINLLKLSKLSHRRIADLLEINRGIVHNIAKKI